MSAWRSLAVGAAKLEDRHRDRRHQQYRQDRRARCTPARSRDPRCGCCVVAVGRRWYRHRPVPHRPGWWPRARAKSAHRSKRSFGSFASALASTGSSRGQLGALVADGGWRRREMLADDDCGVRMLERWRARQQMKRGGRQRILVGPAVESFTHQLLGCGVGHRADGHVRRRQAADVVGPAGDSEVRETGSAGHWTRGWRAGCWRV